MRINGTTKSALGNHFAESVAGAITIRAFEEEDRFFEKNLELIDKNAGSYFYNFAATEWLIQRLETMSAAVLSFSAFIMALLPTGTFSSGEHYRSCNLHVSLVHQIYAKTLGKVFFSEKRPSKFCDSSHLAFDAQ